MKDSTFNFIFKGTALAVCGSLIAFFPNIITMIFYILGGIIIIGSIGTLFSSLSNGSGGLMLPGSIIGVLVGVFVIFLPKIISVQISVIAGLIFGVIGIARLVKGISGGQNKKTLDIVVGVIMIAAGIFFVFNPFKASTIIRIAIGVVMLLMALYYYYAAYVASHRS